jgi:hypothetical protein
MIMRWAITALLLASTPSLRGGEVLDRLVATVNGHAVLESDWDDEVRFESFMSGRPLAAVTSEDRKAALHRLIDQELLREQMRSSDFQPVTSAEIEKQLDSVRAEYERAHESSSWSSVLASYGLTEAVAKARIAVELDQLRLVDIHLRPLVQVDAAEIETYYKEQIVPKFPVDKAPSLQDARRKIRELLVQQKIDEQLSSWLDTLRSQARIKLLVNSSAEGDHP